MTVMFLLRRRASLRGQMKREARPIEVAVRDGVVWLGGAVLAAPADRIRRLVARARGVRGVEDQLDVHEQADVPSP